MVEINGLNKTYTSKENVSVKAIDNTYLSLGDSGLVFIVGTSGSGKTTLLNVISGLDRADSGEVKVGNKNLSVLNQKELDCFRRDKVGIVFQEFNLFEDMNVYENVVLPLKIMGVRKDEEKKLAKATLHLVSLDGFEKRKISELSTGQKQRIAIAKGIIKQPEILLLDEPTGNLDDKNTIAIFELLKEISERCLVILVSHDIVNANRFADKIISISNGKVNSIIDRENNGNKRISKLKVTDELHNEILLDSDKDIGIRELLLTMLEENETKKKLNFEIEYEEIEQRKEEIAYQNFNKKGSLKGLSWIDKWSLSLVNFKTRKGRLFVTYVLFILTSLYTLLMFSLLNYDYRDSMIKYLKHSNVAEYGLYTVNKYTDKLENKHEVTINKGEKLLKTVESIASKDNVLKQMSFDSIYAHDEENSLSDVCVNVYNTPDLIKSQVSGSYPGKCDEIIITDYLAEKLYGKTDVIGETLNNYRMGFKVVGVQQTTYRQEESSQDESLLMDKYAWIVVSQSYVDFLRESKTDIKLDGCNFTESNAIDSYADSKMTFHSAKGIQENVLICGKWPEKRNEVVISSMLAENMGIPENKNFKESNYSLINLNDNVYKGAFDTINLYDYYKAGVKVVGIFDTYKSQKLLNTDALIDDEIYKELNEKYYNYYYYNSIRNLNKDMDEDTLQRFEKSNIYIDESGCSLIYNFREYIGNIRTILLVLFLLAFSIFIFFLISYVSYTISDKKKSIGIMRSMGIAIGDIKQIFISNVLVITLLSIAVVVPVYVKVIKILNSIFVRNYIIENDSLLNFDIIQIDKCLMLVTELIFVAIAVILSLVPIIKMGRKSVVEMLK